MLLLDTDKASGRHTVYINASAYKNTACPRRAFLTLIAGLRESTDYKKEFGTAFHKFAQAYHSGLPATSGYSIAMEHYAEYQSLADWRDLQYLLKTCQAYYNWHESQRIYTPIRVDGLPVLEKKFAVPFLSTPVADYVLCGTVDMLAQHPAFGLVLVDHKTTSIRTRDSYLAEYTFSPQLLMYTMMMHKLEQPIAGAIINGIFMGKGQPPVIQLSDLITFSQPKLTEFESGLRSFVYRLDTALVAYKLSPTSIEIFRRDYNQCGASKFGLCPFSVLCTLDTQPEIDALASTMFERKPYNPLTNYETIPTIA